MIAYLDEKENKKYIVFAKVIGDINKIKEKINKSKYGNSLDKFCLRKYLFESMISDYNNFNDLTLCNPNDILENIDFDFNKLEKIFNDLDYGNSLMNAEVYANRLLMLKFDILPYVKLQEIDRIIYDEKMANKNEKLKNNIMLNTEIVKLVNTKKTQEYSDENLSYRPAEENRGKSKKLKLTIKKRRKGHKSIN